LLKPTKQSQNKMYIIVTYQHRTISKNTRQDQIAILAKRNYTKT